MRKINVLFWSVALIVSGSCQDKEQKNTEQGESVQTQRPNILFCIADDASFPHMGAYRTSWVKTPGFDRVAEEGLLFMNAYTPNAKCAPSRSVVLTGRNSWQLEEAANHWNNFPAKFKTYVEALGENGYVTGHTGKGWGPGIPGEINGKTRELTGKPYREFMEEAPTKNMSGIDYTANFKLFLEDTKGQPWAFWYGGYEPHRAYEYGTGVSVGGKSPSQLDTVPAFWPDDEIVRNDILDYALEVEHFDSHLLEMIEMLEGNGQLENTIIIVTSDNGMPFPRVKGQEYELSGHMPLAIMWPKGIKDPGRVIEDYVSFVDLAPTFIDVAGLEWEATHMAATPGKSLTNLFQIETAGEVTRDFLVFGKERHDIGRPSDVGYPIRGIVKEGLMYIKNFEPSRWPTGNPETGYLNTDGSPTKTLILDMRRSGENREYWQMNFGKRPAEELYNVKDDFYCVTNLADDASYTSQKEELESLLVQTLTEQQDPRIEGNGDIFDQYPYMGKQTNFYERYMNGEKFDTGWVNDTDFEKGKFEE